MTVPFAIVLFVLMLLSTVRQPECLLLGFVLYAPVVAVLSLVKIPFEPAWVLVVFLFLLPNYHALWAFAVDRARVRGSRGRVALCFFLVHYLALFGGLAYPDLLDGVEDHVVTVSIGLGLFLLWQAILLWRVLRSWYRVAG